MIRYLKTRPQKRFVYLYPDGQFVTGDLRYSDTNIITFYV
jgi:hypothetical protein